MCLWTTPHGIYFHLVNSHPGNFHPGHFTPGVWIIFLVEVIVWGVIFMGVHCPRRSCLGRDCGCVISWRCLSGSSCPTRHTVVGCLFCFTQYPILNESWIFPQCVHWDKFYYTFWLSFLWSGHCCSCKPKNGCSGDCKENTPQKVTWYN